MRKVVGLVQLIFGVALIAIAYTAWTADDVTPGQPAPTHCWVREVEVRSDQGKSVTMQAEVACGAKEDVPVYTESFDPSQALTVQHQLDADNRRNVDSTHGFQECVASGDCIEVNE